MRHEPCAAPFFSLVGGTPYTLGSPGAAPGLGLKGWVDATLELSAPGIVTFTDLGETSDDKVIFYFVPNGSPVTTYSDPRFASSIF
jgi:hypothetical protein